MPIGQTSCFSTRSRKIAGASRCAANSTRPEVGGVAESDSQNGWPSAKKTNLYQSEPQYPLGESRVYSTTGGLNIPSRSADCPMSDDEYLRRQAARPWTTAEASHGQLHSQSHTIHGYRHHRPAPPPPQTRVDGYHQQMSMAERGPCSPPRVTGRHEHTPNGHPRGHSLQQHANLPPYHTPLYVAKAVPPDDWNHSREAIQRDYEATLNAFKNMGNPQVRAHATAMGEDRDFSGRLRTYSYGPFDGSDTRRQSRRHSWLEVVDTADDGVPDISEPRSPPVTYFSEPVLQEKGKDHSAGLSTKQATPTKQQGVCSQTATVAKEDSLWMQDFQTLQWGSCWVAVTFQDVRVSTQNAQGETVTEIHPAAEISEVRKSAGSEFQGGYLELITSSQRYLFAVPGENEDVVVPWLDAIRSIMRSIAETTDSTSLKSPSAVSVGMSVESGYISGSQDNTLERDQYHRINAHPEVPINHHPATRPRREGEDNEEADYLSDLVLPQDIQRPSSRRSISMAVANDNDVIKQLGGDFDCVDESFSDAQELSPRSDQNGERSIAWAPKFAAQKPTVKRWLSNRMPRRDREETPVIAELVSTERKLTEQQLEDFKSHGPTVRRYTRISSLPVDHMAAPTAPIAPQRHSAPHVNFSTTSQGNLRPSSEGQATTTLVPTSSNRQDILDSLTGWGQRLSSGAENNNSVPESDSECTRQGHLWRQEPSSLLWKQWWVTLSKLHISLFQMQGKDQKVISRINLIDIAKINRIFDLDGIVQEQRFELVTENEEVHLFSAQSGADCNQWIIAVRDGVREVQRLHKDDHRRYLQSVALPNQSVFQNNAARLSSPRGGYDIVKAKLRRTMSADSRDSVTDQEDGSLMHTPYVSGHTPRDVRKHNLSGQSDGSMDDELIKAPTRSAVETIV